MKKNKRTYTNPKWILSTKVVRLPEQFIPALIEIALEWQQNHLPDNLD